MIGYLDMIRSKERVKSEIQDQYYNALKVRLGVTEGVPYTSLKELKRLSIFKQKLYLEFIMEYLIVAKKSLYEIVQ